MQDLIDSGGREQYLANHRTPEVARGGPLELRDAVFLVGPDRTPEGGDRLAVCIIFCLKRQDNVISHGKIVSVCAKNGGGVP